MRRILFFLAFAIVGFVANAQSTVYVVFTSTENQAAANGAWHTVNPPNPQIGREYPSHVISLFNQSSNACLTLVSREMATVKKNKNFLNTVPYIDWDAIASTLSKSQVQVKFNEILQHEAIYFIDRNDMAGDEILMIPVKKCQSTY